MTKSTKWHVLPAKTQVSLCIRTIWSESLLLARRKLGSLATHWAHIKGSNQTGRMPRLIWVFAGRTCHFVGFVMRWLILPRCIFRNVLPHLQNGRIIAEVEAQTGVSVRLKYIDSDKPMPVEIVTSNLLRIYRVCSKVKSAFVKKTATPNHIKVTQTLRSGVITVRKGNRTPCCYLGRRSIRNLWKWKQMRR